jgi:hypothetical protein
MITAHYIGNHSKDGFLVRLGWALTRLVQRGQYKRVTHSEAIHKIHDDGTVTIASSSLRDKGVRAKRVRLTKGQWLIIEVPSWDVNRSIDLLDQTKGTPYDSLGAISTALLLGQNDGRFFCNEWVGKPFLQSSSIFSPAEFATICASFGEDITERFFRG